MDAPIQLANRLLAQGRNLTELGCHREARKALEGLLTLAGVEPHLRSQAHFLLAEHFLDLQCYRKARRHLTSVLILQPDNSEAHYWMAMAIDFDPDADPKRAWKHLRKAVNLDRTEASYWSALGQLGLRLGKNRSALTAFRQAAELESDDLSIVDEIVDGLLALDRESEAQAVLTSARFRLRGDAEIERLWNRFCFGRIARQQQRVRIRVTAGESGPAVLAFTPNGESTGKRFGVGVIRDDRFSKATPHLRVVGAARPNPRRAP
jgi:tetratricopeptide (TPR) repeat protein